MNYKNVYWDHDSLPNAPSIVAIGDSWFWYPFPGGSLLNALGPMVATRQHTIFAIGNNGAEAFDYVKGVYKDQVRTAFASYGAGLSAVFISGGGNDFAGFNDLRPLLKGDCSGLKTAKGCFQTQPGGPLDTLMSEVESNVATLVRQVLKASRKGTEVFLHTYDNAIPSGKALFSNGGSWLKQALVDARVDSSLQRDCVVFLIDEFAKRLQAVAARNPSRVFVVDSRGTLKPGDWANELHPTPAGFARIAAVAWHPILQAHQLSL